MWYNWTVRCLFATFSILLNVMLAKGHITRYASNSFLIPHPHFLLKAFPWLISYSHASCVRIRLVRSCRCESGCPFVVHLNAETPQLAAAETKNPRRNLPKAIRVYIRLLLFYIGGTFIIGLLVPSNNPLLNMNDTSATDVLSRHSRQHQSCS